MYGLKFISFLLGELVYDFSISGSGDPDKSGLFLLLEDGFFLFPSSKTLSVEFPSVIGRYHT